MKVVLLSSTYQNNRAVLKFYHPGTEKIILVTDKSEHHSHCLITPQAADQVAEWDGIIKMTPKVMFDVIKDRDREVVDVQVRDPLVIKNLRESFPTWESDIKYYQNYVYDNKLVVGKWYNLSADGSIKPHSFEGMIELKKIDMEGVVQKDKFELQLKKWIKLLSEPIPEIKRLAFDIEVHSDGNTMPDPLVAPNQVTAISFHGSDGRKQVFVLERDEFEKGEEDKDKDYEIVWYKSEKEMLEDTFKLIDSYPMVITYNGDLFDMPYLYNRALKLGTDYNPFRMMSNHATLKHGIHIDMYGVFSNRSLKIYAFNAKYVENSLNEVSEALLGEEKVEYTRTIAEMKLHALAKYCYHDSRLTYTLSSYNNNMVMNLLIILCRIGNLPIDDISRQAINNWIKSLFYFTHKLNNQIIPKSSDFPVVDASTTADIKDKKYQGATVLEPKKGVHFGVTVLDFASLYPSIIKVKNLSYETVCCSHEECKSNLIPFTKHWSCTKKSGTSALLIGSLKELRVNHFKVLSKNAATEEEREINDTIAQALKVFLNASYGVLGFDKFPLYFLPTAEAITAMGRDIISQTMKAADSKSLPVLYGDTDSIFVHQPSQEQIDYLIEFTRKHYAIDLEVDKEYKYLVLSDRKKNYFGVKTDGKLDIKGLSGKKSNTPVYLRGLFTEIMDLLKTIETPSDFPTVKQVIEKKIKDTVANFDNIPLDQLAVKMFINKDPSEYKVKTPVMTAAKQLSKKPEKGDLVQFVKTLGKTTVKPIEIVKRHEIDKPKYMEGFESVLEQITEPMQINLAYLTKGQTNLDMW